MVNISTNKLINYQGGLTTNKYYQSTAIFCSNNWIYGGGGQRKCFTNSKPDPYSHN